MTGRLIVNHRGETAKVIPTTNRRGSVILQVSAFADSVTPISSTSPLGPLTIVEVTFGKHEIAALCLQLADSIGMACELTKLKQPETRGMRVTGAAGAAYVLKSITPKDA